MILKILKSKPEFTPAVKVFQAFPWISRLGTSTEHHLESIILLIHCSKYATYSHLFSYCLKIYAHFLILSSTVFYSEVLKLKTFDWKKIG